MRMKPTIALGTVAILLLSGILMAQLGSRGSGENGRVFSRSAQGRSGLHAHHQGKRKRGMRFLARYLDLSDEQKGQVAAIMTEELAGIKEEAEAKREQIKPIQEELRSLMQQEAFDEDAIRSLLAQRSALGEDRQLTRLRIQHRIFWEVLTAEQREKAQELFDLMAPDAGGFGARGEGPFGPPF